MPDQPSTPEVCDRPGSARMRVADVGREEFDIALCRRVTEIGDQRRDDIRRPLVEDNFGLLDRCRKLWCRLV